MSTVTVILTCYNRSELTANCIRTLYETNCSNHFSFIVVDDNSSDNTLGELGLLSAKGAEIHIINGDGKLYWAGGMRKGIEYARDNKDSDFYLFVNDDVSFFDSVIDGMVEASIERHNECVLVGACSDQNGQLTYGGIKYTGKGVRYEYKGGEYQDNCDTFNMNCVLIPGRIFRENGNFDQAYVHSLADFDYGLTLSKRGIPIVMYKENIGICEKNKKKGTWEDVKLPIMERIKQKETVKGAPLKTWFHFLHKHFGIKKALIYSITPYIRILLRR